MGRLLNPQDRTAYSRPSRDNSCGHQLDTNPSSDHRNRSPPKPWRSRVIFILNGGAALGIPAQPKAGKAEWHHGEVDRLTRKVSARNHVRSGSRHCRPPCRKDQSQPHPQTRDRLHRHHSRPHAGWNPCSRPPPHLGHHPFATRRPRQCPKIRPPSSLPRQGPWARARRRSQARCFPQTSRCHAFTHRRPRQGQYLLKIPQEIIRPLGRAQRARRSATCLIPCLKKVGRPR